LLLSKEATLQDDAELPSFSQLSEERENPTPHSRESFAVKEAFSPREGHPYFRGRKKLLRKKGPSS